MAVLAIVLLVIHASFPLRYGGSGPLAGLVSVADAVAALLRVAGLMAHRGAA